MVWIDRLTDQTTLLLYYRTQITENVVELMDSTLDFPDLGFAFCDQRLLEFKLLGRDPTRSAVSLWRYPRGDDALLMLQELLSLDCSELYTPTFLSWETGPVRY